MPKNSQMSPAHTAMRKALIAMSGGVDSSVSAYLMTKAGYDCIGVTMKLYSGEDIGADKSKTCCSLDDVEDARQVAYKLGIPYYVFNFSGDFRTEVMERFVTSYESGATPNPCIDCNRHLKFDRLYRRAKELGCDCVVTGHYARIEQNGDRYILKKSANPEKDQSYVLYSLTQEQLAHTLFPLGNMAKEETRKIATEQGFFNADKPDSQDICFVPDGDYASFICRYRGKTYPEGDFVDLKGNKLGRHHGIIHYTLGQRKGLGISAGEPLYVIRIEPETNRVVLGKNSDLFTKELDADGMNWIAIDEPSEPVRVKAKVRYRQAEQWATATVTEHGKMHLVFDEPQRAITKGQAVVLYDGDIVVAGGIIR